MLLWITDSNEQYQETDRLIVRSPQQLAAIPPQSPSFVFINVIRVKPQLLAWAEKRTLPTLWWHPIHKIPRVHCQIRSNDCSAEETVALLDEIYHQQGGITLQHGELAKALDTHAFAFIARLPHKNAHQENTAPPLFHGELGYIIYRDIDWTLEDFTHSKQWVHEQCHAEWVYSLSSSKHGDNLLILFKR